MVGDVTVGDSAGAPGEAVLPHAANIVQLPIRIMSRAVTLNHWDDMPNPFIEIENTYPST